MSDDHLELVRGSGNVFRDLGMPDPEIRQAKAILAAAILKIFDARAWSTRKAQEMTGADHADFARIRRVKLDRFSMERLATNLDRLGQQVEFSVRVRPSTTTADTPAVVQP